MPRIVFEHFSAEEKTEELIAENEELKAGQQRMMAEITELRKLLVVVSAKADSLATQLDEMRENHPGLAVPPISSESDESSDSDMFGLFG
ncbi:hypothetical protein PCE1_003219 [Barthelona sp. PCE]